MMNMKLNYWYHLTKSTENSWLRAAFCENLKNAQGPHASQGWSSRFAKEILDIQKDVDFLDPTIAKSKNGFRAKVAKNTNPTSTS